MTNKVAIFAKLQAPDGKGAELESAIWASIEEINHEEGTELYIVHHSEKEPDVVRLYELYRDRDAKSAHATGQALKELGRSLKGLLTSAPELIVTHVIGGKGS